ncbi:MAG: hypothetical protein ACRD0G_15575 [Acidimicrobiales bacterium]
MGEGAVGDPGGKRYAGGELPWASVFDPVANARALAEVQLRGLEAAGALVDRFVASLDNEPPPGNGDASGGTASPNLVVDSWAELVRRSLDAFGRLAGSAPAGNGHVQVDVTTGAPAGVLRVGVDRAAAADEPAATELWLHNPTGDELGPIRLHCGDLRASDGTLLGSAAVAFDPAEIDSLPARSSRGVVVRVEAAAEQPAGRYRDTILAEGAPQIWLPFEVVVT